jgi:hypothetical protein
LAISGYFWLIARLILDIPGFYWLFPIGKGFYWLFPIGKGFYWLFRAKVVTPETKLTE